jgi:hypothetical protein
MASMMTLMLAVALQDDPLAVELLKAWKHPWAGFGPGSSVTYRQTSKRPDIDPKGELVYRDEAETLTYTIVTQQGEAPTLRIRSGDVSSDVPYFTPAPSWLRGRGERRGAETLKVGDVTFECRVARFVLDEGKDLSQVTTVHTCAAAPVWALRLRVETLANGKVNTAEEERCVAIDQVLKIGGREVVCQLIELRTEVTDGPVTVKREWRSDEIPGRVARREQKVLQGGKEVPAAAVQMEVVSWESKR